MPLQSEAQRRYLWANDPELARKFESETPKGARLPKRKRTEHSVLKQRVTDLETAVLALGANAEEFGDSPGHEFRGNQWKDGESIQGKNSNATAPRELVSTEQHQALNDAGFKLNAVSDHDRIASFTRGDGDSQQRIVISSTKPGVNAIHTIYRESTRFGDGPHPKVKHTDDVTAAVKYLGKQKYEGPK